jgi:3-oxoacid CoA-transferase subunit B
VHMATSNEKRALTKEQIAGRAAREIKDGMYVNLGIGIPNLIPEHLHGVDVVIHSENGLLGMGPLAPSGEEDSDLVNAAKQPVVILPGSAVCSQADSFAIIRGGHLDMTVLGAFQVSEKGDIANWLVPGGNRVPGVGGAMDLVTGTRQVMVTMTHNGPKGEAKIVKECDYPLTGKGCVDLIVTDLAFIRVTNEGLELEEVAPGFTAEEVQERTEARLLVSPNLKEMDV